jgi:hypothetical protein
MFWTNFRENSPNVYIFAKIFAIINYRFLFFTKNREKNKFFQTAPRIFSCLLHIFAKTFIKSNIFAKNLQNIFT